MGRSPLQPHIARLSLPPDPLQTPAELTAAPPCSIPLKIQLRRRAQNEEAASATPSSTLKNGTGTTPPSEQAARVRALTDASARRRNSARWSFSGAHMGAGHPAHGASFSSSLAHGVGAGGSAAAPADFGLQAEALMRKQEARIEALRAEAAALQFQSESKVQELTAAQRALARRDSDVQALRARVTELESNLERLRQTELQMASELEAAQKRGGGGGGFLSRVGAAARPSALCGRMNAWRILFFLISHPCLCVSLETARERGSAGCAAGRHDGSARAGKEAERGKQRPLPHEAAGESQRAGGIFSVLFWLFPPFSRARSLHH